jgi:hypothetical protein
VPYANISIAIEEFVRGELPASAANVLTVEVLIPDVSLVETLSTLLGGAPSIFFVRSKAEELAELGFSAQVQDREGGFYRLTSSQGLGQASSQDLIAPLSDNPKFAAMLNGISLGSVISEARSP